MHTADVPVSFWLGCSATGLVSRADVEGFASGELFDTRDEVRSQYAKQASATFPVMMQSLTLPHACKGVKVPGTFVCVNAPTS